MKKFFKYLGFGVLSVVVFFVAIIVITSIGGVDKKETFPPYIEEAVPKLATWDIDQYEILMSKKGFGSATPRDWQIYLDMFEKLGVLQKVGVPNLQNSRVESKVSSGSTTYATYLVPLIFDTGEAQVQLGLQYSSEKIEINSVRFLSDRLFE